jgi:hypothetical protein
MNLQTLPFSLVDVFAREPLPDDRRARADEDHGARIRELRRPNEILRSAAVFFGVELDRRSPR